MTLARVIDAPRYRAILIGLRSKPTVDNVAHAGSARKRRVPLMTSEIRQCAPAPWAGPEDGHAFVTAPPLSSLQSPPTKDPEKQGHKVHFIDLTSLYPIK